MSFLSFNISSFLNEARFVFPQKHRSSRSKGSKAECHAGCRAGPTPWASSCNPSSRGGPVPAQPGALNWSDTIWLVTYWRHNWVKTCLAGKDNPKSGAPHCIVLPAGLRRGALGTQSPAVPSCPSVSASIHTHTITPSPGSETTPPQSLKAGGHGHMSRDTLES